MKYFKIAFLSVSSGLTVGLVIFGWFNSEFTDLSSFGSLVLRSVTVGITVGIVLGLLNMYLKIIPGRRV